MSASPIQPITAPIAAARSWSPYQQAVFDCFTTSQGNIIVEAVAGSGKTTTLVEALRLWLNLNRGKRAIFVAFNKSIATELASKVPAGVDAKTLHGACYGAIRRRFPNVKVDDHKLDDIAKTLLAGERVEPSHQMKVATDLARSYGLLKGTMTDLADNAAVEEVLGAYEITLDFPQTSIELLPKLDKKMVADTSRITFDEMLSFVIDHNIAPFAYDMVCVDEAQDMNLMQITILKMMVRRDGRFCAVGDTFQSIYAFRGADQQAMERIKREFSIREQNQLPLSITYRCPVRVVKAAQEFVPHIEASETAAEGLVLHRGATEADYQSTLNGMEPGDMGICRANAPLVSAALTLIAKGKKATIRGRDIGKSISKLVRDLVKRYKANTVDELAAAASQYAVDQATKLRAARKDNQAQGVEDRCETLIAIITGAKDLSQVESRIERLFSDTTERESVVFSSIHKAKGLEADKVVWIAPEVTDWILKKIKTDAARQQERNLMYVAITRAKRTLIYQPMPKESKEDA